MTFTCRIREPGILVGHCGPQQVDNNPGEVNVDNHHDIELSEELQLQQVPCCLPICLRKQAPMSAWSCKLRFCILELRCSWAGKWRNKADYRFLACARDAWM